MNKIYNNLNVKNLVKTDWINQFDEFQKEEIIIGLKKGLDVSIYANPKFSFSQMRQIKSDLEDNLNVSIYAKKELDWEQMRKIRWELEKEDRKKLENE